MKMTTAEKAQLEELLKCPVCRDIFKDPRQLPCGHSMCMSCLESMADHTSSFPLRCPDCRSYFGEIEQIVQKNYTLANIVENFRFNRRREEATKVVNCDCCLDKKPAIKTCLKCELSMCEWHVKKHLELPVFTGHPLVRPLGDLQERKCPQHEDEVLRYFCSASRRYICNLCALESKQLNLATESSTVLRRQLIEYMDLHFKMFQDQITESTDLVRKLKDDIRRQRPRVNSLNSVTVVLLCLWFIVLYYAYQYSLENQTLRDSLSTNQNYVPVQSIIAGIPALHRDAAGPCLGVPPDQAAKTKARLDSVSKNAQRARAPDMPSTHSDCTKEKETTKSCEGQRTT